MTLPTLDPIRAAAIEKELAAIGTGHSRLQRHQRRTHRLQVALGSVALAGLLTGAAVVVVSGAFPGGTTTGVLGEPVSGTYTGTASIELGPVPRNADVVILDITCTEGGEMTVPLLGRGEIGDEAGWNCGDGLGKPTVHISDGKLPEGGSTTYTVTADPGTVWSATAQYGTLTSTEWAVNANGQTYGVGNENGTPDLSPALATNGKLGYIVNSETLFPGDDGYINVYEADGTTIVGQFTIGDSDGNQTGSGVNANGQTYGLDDEDGTLDLVVAPATNGKIGYISTEEQAAHGGSGYINVYENDGTTVIGKFPIGNVGDQSSEVSE